jgi:type IV fimbrial biogenesis protein FimT
MMQFNYRGFHLIEIIITLGIISMLLLFCVGFSFSFERQAIQNISHRLFHTLAWARSEAIKRNQLVGICGSLDLKHCSNDWSHGYIVFMMNDEKSIRQDLLRSEKITPFAKIDSGKQTVIRYSGDGRCLERASINISKEKSEQRIVIYDSGRARIETLN